MNIVLQLIACLSFTAHISAQYTAARIAPRVAQQSHQIARNRSVVCNHSLVSKLSFKPFAILAGVATAGYLIYRFLPILFMRIELAKFKSDVEQFNKNINDWYAQLDPVQSEDPLVENHMKDGDSTRLANMARSSHKIYQAFLDMVFVLDQLRIPEDYHKIHQKIVIGNRMIALWSQILNKFGSCIRIDLQQNKQESTYTQPDFERFKDSLAAQKNAAIEKQNQLAEEMMVTLDTLKTLSEEFILV